MFFKLAKEVCYGRGNSKTQFTLVGSLVDRDIDDFASSAIVMPSPDQPLSRAEFCTRAKAIDYALFFLDPAEYELRASGTLFDAFAFLKPIIAIENPFFDYYFRKMGDIGYLCKDYEEMKSVVQELVNKPATDRYCRQQHNIARWIREFNNENQARKFAEIATGIWD
ncbi:hypothetical protein DESUT3_17410 [Desulfuromonas versatilis]|uniref:Uncharacterized protein n=1 Tax=Desulfuromonas versatilis TaxID=2802975 RepID=A0ABM8HQY6_9BACT|nr:hypothetical protein DESUT3_17410 [Desulfuromonas versatilis]